MAPGPALSAWAEADERPLLREVLEEVVELRVWAARGALSPPAVFQCSGCLFLQPRLFKSVKISQLAGTCYRRTDRHKELGIQSHALSPVNGRKNLSATQSLTGKEMRLFPG
jgi:hypothetical protein